MNQVDGDADIDVDDGLPAVTPADSSTVVRVILCRHGETELNARQELQGSGVDPPLNARGTRQGQCLAKRLQNTHIDWIISSQLHRAVQTAGFIKAHHPATPFEIYPELAEICWGVHEGVHNPDLDYLHKAWREGDFALRPENGESAEDAAERSIAALLDIVARAAKLDTEQQHKTVVIVAHGRLIRILLAALLHKSLFFMSSFTHQNTGMNVIDFLVQPGDREQATTYEQFATADPHLFRSAVSFSSLPRNEQRATLQAVLEEQTRLPKLECFGTLPGGIFGFPITVSTADNTPPPGTAPPNALAEVDWLFEDADKPNTSEALIVTSNVGGQLGTVRRLGCLWQTSSQPVTGRRDSTINFSAYHLLPLGILYNDVSHLAWMTEEQS
ncbi:hypothetical protein RI367_008076 [Sorochytrium milnesiophthora]